jgi:hypothetical protein
MNTAPSLTALAGKHGGPFDKNLYLQGQRPIIKTGPNGQFETPQIDPLDWVSLPDLFFGDNNYQQMVPSLELPNTPAEPKIQAQQLVQSHFTPEQHQHLQQYLNPMTAANYPSRQVQQAAFPPEKVNDFKHVIYNLLVENHNNPHKSNFIMPCTIEENGVIRTGFCFNEAENPEKKLPELYAQHIRKARLDQEDISSVFVHDLYKFYLRASVELLSKYFEKRDKYTYLYEDTPLFIPNDTLEHAEERIRNMKTRARKKRKLLPS